jgi:hypothetical protein
MTNILEKLELANAAYHDFLAIKERYTEAWYAAYSNWLRFSDDVLAKDPNFVIPHPKGCVMAVADTYDQFPVINGVVYRDVFLPNANTYDGRVS